jgi:hypothetical protein
MFPKPVTDLAAHPSVAACHTEDLPDFHHQGRAMLTPTCTANLIWYDVAGHTELNTVNE